jgi:hypothetical protein
VSRELLNLALAPEAVQALCRALGGADLRVPAHPKGDGYELLVAIIGPEAAHALIRFAGGDTLYVPRCTRDALAERDRRIVELAEQGMTPADIARSFVYAATVTERHVYRILARKARH